MEKDCDKCKHFNFFDEENFCKRCKWYYTDKFEERAEEPKPCPFCGGTPTVAREPYGFIVHCTNPSCLIFMRTRGFSSDKEAIDAWNGRYNEGVQDEIRDL